MSALQRQLDQLQSEIRRLQQQLAELQQSRHDRSGWVRGLRSAGTNAGWARTPSGGIPAASDDGTDLTPGSATCTLMEDDGTISPVSPSENVTIYSSQTGSDIPGDIVIGWIERPSGKKYIDLGNCPASGGYT